LLLQTLGYDITLHVGGVHGPDGPQEELMHNHLVLQAHGLPTHDNPDGHWYLDAGLGDALHEPLPLIAGTYHQGPFEFELFASDSPIADWRFRHRAGGSFSGMAFRAAPASIDDFADRNVHLSTSPESGFVKLLTVQRRDATGVHILRGQMLKHVGETASDEVTLSTRQEWFDALGDVFALPLGHVTPADADLLWERVNATHRAFLAEQSQS
jgi:arylamine N-acetyltransferase